MSILVSLAELKTYLGDAPASDDDAVLTELLDNVEANFASETGRTIDSFQAASPARTEVKDGTGSRELYLDYPVSVLTSVKLGYDVTSPDETLNVSDKNVLVYAVGSRRLSRTDGWRFGRSDWPRYVTIVYDAAADIPDSSKLAIKSVAASAYRRRGSEAEKSETLGAFYSHTLIDSLASSDPFWTDAVMANRRVHLV